MSHRPAYSLHRLPGAVFGAEVTGINLAAPVDRPTVEAIKRDVTEHRLLVFRGQPATLSGQRLAEISAWFGPLESTFYKHPASPHPDVFRVSNDPAQGCTGVGRTGWHVDGSFQSAPFSYSLYQIVSVPRQGATVFMPLHELLASLPAGVRARWERLHMRSDRRSGGAKPLVYTHPRSGLDAMCFHTGMTGALVWDLGTPAEREAAPAEAAALLEEIEGVFGGGGAPAALRYAHAWREGDLLMSDNAALGHEASPETQLPTEQVGLRVMHRTTVAGGPPPAKGYRIDAAGRRLPAAGEG